MSKLSDSVQRDRFIDSKGQYGHNEEKRCIVSDRSKPIVKKPTVKEIEDRGSLQQALINSYNNIS